MIKTPSRFLTTMYAAEIMTVAPTLIPRDMSLEAAARMLSRDQISGAPVVDDLGRCVGVLSTTDYLHWVERRGRPIKESHDHSECVCAWQMVDVEKLPDDTVSSWMTHDPVTATPDTPICDLARAMTDAHIHRIVVVDENGRPIGVVSSTDILAAVARAKER
jgi:CBS domain-containing protein